jgi:hypothetical protein
MVYNHKSIFPQILDFTKKFCYRLEDIGNSSPKKKTYLSD